MPVNLRNVPHFRQELPFSCLAACARMILAFSGVLHTEEEIRRHLGTAPHGTPARSLFLLRALGFEVRIEQSDLKQLEDSLVAGVPPLVFLETSHLEYWTQRCDHVAVLVGIDAAA